MFNYLKLRKDFEIYQRDLAEMLGFSQPNLSRLENENIEPSKSTLKKLNEHFGEETIKKYYFDETPVVNAVGNVNGDGVQNNGIQSVDTELLSIIKRQNETISKQISLWVEISSKLSGIYDEINKLKSKGE